MVINLEKSRLVAPMFDGRGFMAAGFFVSECSVPFRENSEEPTNFYLSHDAVSAILQWVRMWELHLQGDDSLRMDYPQLNINGVVFTLYSIADYDYNELKNIHPSRATQIFDTIRQNFATGFTERKDLWEKANHPFGSYSAESFNVLGRRMEFDYDNAAVRYNYQIVNQPIPAPYASLELTMVKIADALLSVANTNTYPQAGYELGLKLGFGDQKLADLTRDQLREIAQRLIP
ncbi:hypothetical protein NY967_000180 [Salmonella enterica]|nr:hypothetical protein [Salmonella enterica]